MRRGLGLLVASVALIALAGCGQDRSALAHQTVQTYWNDIGSGKIHSAYEMLTSGNRQVEDYQTFDQNILGFLDNTASLQASVGKPRVNGDQATVPVTLHSVKTSKPLAAYQHLFWENGAWRISDANGGLTKSP